MDDRNQQLFDDLCALIARVDPLPRGVRAEARAAFEWRTTGAELAAVVYDSALDDPLEAAAGSRTAHRRLMFRTSELAIVLDVRRRADRTFIRGRVVPATRGAIHVRHGFGKVDTLADRRGRFALDLLPPGPFSLRCVLGGDRRRSNVVTESVRL